MSTNVIVIVDIIQSILLAGILAFAIHGHRTHRHHEEEMAARDRVIQQQRDELNRLEGMYRAILGVSTEELKVEHTGTVEVEHKEGS